jgi:hypothetical protein
MIAQPWHPLCSIGAYAKGAFMPNRDLDRTSERDPRSTDDDVVRGRGDDMDDMSDENEEFEDTEDLDEGDEEDEGSF